MRGFDKLPSSKYIYFFVCAGMNKIKLLPEIVGAFLEMTLIPKEGEQGFFYLNFCYLRGEKRQSAKRIETLAPLE